METLLAYKALAGKGIERGLIPEEHEDYVLFRYLDTPPESVWNNDRSAIRSLAERLGAGEVSLRKVNDRSFMVEVRQMTVDEQMNKLELLIEEIKGLLDRYDTTYSQVA